MTWSSALVSVSRVLIKADASAYSPPRPLSFAGALRGRRLNRKLVLGGHRACRRLLDRGLRLLRLAVPTLLSLCHSCLLVRLVVAGTDVKTYEGRRGRDAGFSRPDCSPRQ